MTYSCNLTKSDIIIGANWLNSKIWWGGLSPDYLYNEFLIVYGTLINWRGLIMTLGGVMAKLP